MFKIRSCNLTINTLVIPTKAEFVKELESVQKCVIIFGIKKIKVDIIISNNLQPNQIALSSHIIEQINLPLSCLYEISLNDNEIIIGPFIGILTDITNRKMAEMLPTYKSFVSNYSKIGGAILVFSLEGIKMEEQVISGFLYQPEKNNWVYGTFPYPGGVMSILEASLTSKWEEFHQKMQHLISIMGPKVFNYPHFSKWEMYTMLAPKMGNALPRTTIYKDVMDIANMLHTYKSIYIKPINGRLGQSIYKVTKDSDTEIVVKYYKGRERKQHIFKTNDEIIAFFKQHLLSELFLIQETIPLRKYQDRVLDFRVMMVKNEVGSWENLGIYSRYGADGQIVSNITAGGVTEVAEKTFRKVWDLSEEEIIKVKAEINNIIKEALYQLEENGYHLGNIGFDIGLDENCKIYIIEINHQNPDPYIALKAKQKHKFYLARYKNMLYAKQLAGFKLKKP